ncbi:unnamed protein product [Malus baccata var. baccata]
MNFFNLPILPPPFSFLRHSALPLSLSQNTPHTATPLPSCHCDSTAATASEKTATMEKGKGAMGEGRRWAVDLTDNSTSPSSRDFPDLSGFSRASLEQNDSTVSRQKKVAESTWKAQVLIPLSLNSNLFKQLDLGFFRLRISDILIGERLYLCLLTR